MKKFIVRERNSLKNFTDNTYAQASFCFRALLKSREIRVNGQKVSADVMLNAGDEVCYYLTPAQEKISAFEVIFKDDNVIVVDKASGVHSEAVFSALCGMGETYFIHRLDRNTEGLMIFARTKEAEEELLRAFRERRIKKIYHALVVGHMPERQGVLHAYLQKDERRSFVHISKKPVGESIVTEYEVLREDPETSLLKITLHTGKTHQIRAHMAFIGRPVAGDTKYGDKSYNAAHGAARQKLIAKELTVYSDGVLSYLNGRTFFSSYHL